MVVPYNMGGTDVWDKIRMAMFYSLEATSHCINGGKNVFGV